MNVHRQDTPTSQQWTSLAGEPLEVPVTMSVPMALPLRRTPSAVRGLCLLAFPHGGQRSARRNAWAGMSAEATHNRARAEAEEALGASVARARPVRRDGTAW